MKRIGATLSLAAGLALISATPAVADGFRSYQVCGGTNFQTCAAIEINVVGSNVTMRVWNLSGNVAVTGKNTPANTIINSIGFYNVPAGVQAVVGSQTVSGPARPGDTPSDWTLKNNNKLAFNVDYSTTSGNNALDGIASGCANPASLPSGVDLYLNPCSDPSTDPGSGWVTFNFQISGGSWDPNTSDIVFRGQEPGTGLRTECYTATSPGGRPANCVASAVPEPVTMTLLATGLASMGGAGFIRRRRNKN
ncbi:MAG: PEP-CTERM sorting domain-containing protein, partial [Gemmatimonadales bacterium]